MKRNWEYKKLGDVATFINGYPFKPSEWKSEGCPIIRIQNLNNPLVAYNYYDKPLDERYIVKSGDVLISWSGTLGVYEWSGEKAFLNQHIFKVLFNKGKINKSFFKYVVSSRIQEMKSKVHGITMQHITKGDFDKTKIPVPPLEDQSRIVAELDLLTGIIDKQNAQLKELDNLAQAIFYDMFGDPIENPKGWEVKKLGDVSTSVSYGTSSPSSTVGKYKYLRMNNITYEGFLDLTDLKYIDMDDAEFEKYSVREGDVLFNRTNSMDLIGKTTYIHNMEPMIIAGYIIRVRLVDSVLPVYVSKFMNMPAMKKKLKGMAKGAVNQANINSKELKSIDIPLPPLALQQSFAEKIQSIEKQKETIRASIADTQKLLDYTMDKYFG